MKKVLLSLSVLLAGLSLGSCSQTNWEIDEDATKIVVAASPTPHAEILEVCVPLMEELGYELEIREFTDYVQPNMVTENGDVQANFFQHTPY